MDIYHDDEARAFAAWCLQEVPRKARTTWIGCGKDGPKKTASFECLVMYRDALVSAFQKNCSESMEHTVWHSHQYPIYPSNDRVTVDFVWPSGTLRVDAWTVV